MKQIKHFAIAAIASIAMISCGSSNGSSEFVAENFEFAEQQTQHMVEVMKENIGEKVLMPRTTLPDGSIRYTSMTDWTSGFFPGTLWYLYEYTNSPEWKAEATRFTNALEEIQYYTNDHDIGFMMYCSYGNQYRLTTDKAEKERIKKILVQSAESLITRFNPTVGAIESWNSNKSWNGTIWHNPVIIDNMMNLELLYFASEVTGDPKYADIATTHATTTMKNHFREDFSSYHVVDYDAETGEVLHRQACQGYSDNSMWARGQGWGIYGFTLVYRATHDPKFLAFAENLANCYLDHKNLPADMVPYWDFNVNEEGFNPDFKWQPELYAEYMPRDASAAAIVTSALFELSDYSEKYGEKFEAAAVKTLKSLASEEYRAPLHENNDFLLMHSTGSLPHGAEIDKPLVYADYYFLEALLRYQARM